MESADDGGVHCKLASNHLKPPSVCRLWFCEVQITHHDILGDSRHTRAIALSKANSQRTFKPGAPSNSCTNAVATSGCLWKIIGMESAQLAFGGVPEPHAAQTQRH